MTARTLRIALALALAAAQAALAGCPSDTSDNGSNANSCADSYPCPIHIGLVFQGTSPGDVCAVEVTDGGAGAGESCASCTSRSCCPEKSACVSDTTCACLVGCQTGGQTGGRSLAACEAPSLCGTGPDDAYTAFQACAAKCAECPGLGLQ